MSITLDDKLDLPLDDIVYWVSQLIDRERQSELWTDEDRQWIQEVKPDFHDIERQLRVTYAAVIRARRFEFAEYAASIGISIDALAFELVPMRAVGIIGVYLGLLE